MRCARQVRPAVTDDFASTAGAELLQKSDEIVGDASIADKARQSPTLSRARIAKIRIAIDFVFACPHLSCDNVRQEQTGHFRPVSIPG